MTTILTPARARKPRRPLALVGLAGVVACCSATTLAAQSQPLVLQHGIMSDASTWQTNGDGLAQIFNLTPYRFTTGATHTYQDQALALYNYTAGLPDTTIAVGHSNGGIVLRQASRLGRNFKGIVTVATPHRGALLAPNVGMASWYFSDLLSTLGRPFNDYAQFYSISDDPDHSWVVTALSATGTAFNLMAEAANNVLPAYFSLQEQPLLDEMAPVSGYLENQSTGLNSPDNLARESWAIPNRVAIVSTLSSNTGLIFRAGVSSGTAGTLVDVRNATIGALFALFNHYYSYQNEVDQGTVPYDDFAWDKESYAYEFMDAAIALIYTDDHWCGLIGAQDPSSGGCGASDAIVPEASQLYPNYTLLIHQFDAAHNEETTSGTTLQSLTHVFESGPLTISSRGGGGGGGGSLTASVGGPTAVSANSIANWWAVVSGGQPPYTYVWSVDGTEYNRGSNNSFAFSSYGSDFTIFLTVIDAAGTSASDSYYVTVQSCGRAFEC